MFTRITNQQGISDAWKQQLQGFPRASRQAAESALVRFEAAVWYPLALEDAMTTLETEFELNDRGLPLIRADNLPAAVIEIVDTYLALTQQGNGENETVFD